MQEADLDKVATRNGDIQASVPDQGHRTPVRGWRLRGRDRRRDDRRPVVSVLPPRRHHDHGPGSSAAGRLDGNDLDQLGRSVGRTTP